MVSRIDKRKYDFFIVSGTKRWFRNRLPYRENNLPSIIRPNNIKVFRNIRSESDLPINIKYSFYFKGTGFFF